MHVSLGISSLFHAAILGFALLSFGTPERFEVADVNAVPVSIVPFQDITQVMRGQEDASAKNAPAPIPNKVRAPVEDAQNLGQNKVDLKSVEVPKPSKQEVVSSAPPKADPAPRPSDDRTADDTPTSNIQPQPDTQVTPATEIAALPSAAAPVREEPAVDAVKTSDPLPEQTNALPEVGPVPVLRNQIAPAQTAKTPDRKDEELIQNSSRSTNENAFDSDEIASLLNRADSQGGGALSSQRKAGLGSNTSNADSQLSQSEMDALRAQIRDKWSIIPGLADGGKIRIRVSMQLDRSGLIVGQPEVTATGGSDATRRTLAGSARRAIIRAQPYKLPIEKYETWSNVIVNFDPSELF